MADLFSLLGQAGASLSAHRTASATASHNLQNSGTAGYARQSVTLGAVVPADMRAGMYIGRGAMALGVTQARSRFIEAQLPDLLGRAAFATAQSTALRQVPALDLEGPLSPSSALGQFQASLTALGQNPGNLPLREGVLASARQLGLAFNRTAETLDAALRGLDAQVSGYKGEINQLASEVARLNREIRTARASGGEPNDLLDARLRAQDKLAELTGAQVVPDGSGDANLRLPSGGALVAGDVAGRIVFQPDPQNGGHLAPMLQTASGALQPARPGGTVGGLLEARDGALRQSQRQLDEVAHGFATAVNAAHDAGVGLDGQGNRPLFDVGATVEGAASRFGISAAVGSDPNRLAAASGTGTLPGGAGALYAMIAAADAPLGSGASASTSLARLTTAFGGATRQAESLAAHEGTLLTQTLSARESVSGVSVDEELLNLTRSQRAYEAVLKVITTTNEMLDSLLRLKS